MIRYITALLIGVAFLGFGQNTSKVEFTIKNFGINVDGHFKTFTIDAKFNANKELTELSGKVKVASIDTGNKTRDKHLLEEEYFNVKEHDFMTLNSTSFNKKNSNTYEVEASLTIKGKTKTITIPVFLNDGILTSQFEINRRDFDVGGGSFVMSKTVKIKITHAYN